MKNTRLLFVLVMLFLLFTQVYGQEKKDEGSVVNQVTSFLSKHVKLSAYGQFGYSYTDSENLNTRQADNQFFNRYAMFILSGDVTKDLSWMLQYEAFSSTLLELYAYYKPLPYFQIKAGQMKTCFTFENQLSPSTYETINFSRVIERLAGFTGDVCGNQGGRDIGLQVGGEAFKTSFNNYFIEYRAGVFNGSGINKKDHNNAKDFAGWLTVQPVKGLKLGYSAYLGKLNYAFPAKNGEEVKYANITRDRQAFSACFENKRVLCRGEYLWGTDGDIDRNGFYVLGQWYAVPSRWAIQAKVEGYEADTAIPNYETIYTLGTSYHIIGKTRVMFNYVHYNYEKGASVNELWAMLQIGF